jgi:amino acid adenylation domain-containing protein
MTDHSKKLPPEQQAIRDKCFHPSGTFVEFPIEDVETSVCARFEKMVARHPNNWAIVTDSESLTYTELNEHANRAARGIVDQLGSGAEPVALLFESKLALIIAMLGVLKAGKFFVLLDPTWPEARLRTIVDDAQARLMLTEEPTFAIAASLGTDRRRCVDIEACGKHARGDDLQLSIAPETFLSVSYTSGSTAEPKGVIWTHRNLLHSVMLSTNEFRHCDRDRISYLTSGTAAAINHPFLALLVGAAVLPFDVKRHGLDALVSWLRQEEISICSLSTQLFRNIGRMQTGRLDLPSLRLLRLSSEASYKSDFELYREMFPRHCLLANSVTPTETHLLATYLMDHGSVVDSDEIPIGYPVQDKEILLQDECGNEVGSNQIGEIVVRSAYLSGGYWNRPDLTAAKFEPADRESGAGLYRTGDLGLRRPDGCIIHKGRKDFRVKIRGYGVEPAEVEAILRQHPAVREVCVIARANEVSRVNRLVAYFTQNPGECLVGSELRTFLGNRLPDYMIPDAFVALAELPLTPNGKLDRRALPEPDRGRSRLDTPYVAAANELQRQLVALWEEVLDIRPIGVDDNFFDLGGYSLMGARIIGEVHRQYGIELPLRALFEAPTIAQLAASIKIGWKEKRRPGGKDWKYLFVLQAGRDRRPLFFFPGGGGSEPEFFIYAALARHLGREYPVYGLRARGADGFSQSHVSVEEMVAAYLEEIHAIEPEGPYYLIGECAGGVTAYEAARQLRDRGEEVALLALLDVERPTPAKYWTYRAWQILCVSLIKFHWEQLRQLEWKRWPAYLCGKGTGETPTKLGVVQGAELLRARAQAVLETDHFGQAARHVERARTHYRRVVRRYRPQSYAAPITILASEKLYHEDPTLGWSKLTWNNLCTHPVPGDHDAYLREHVHVTAQQLRKCLEQAENRAADKSASSENVQPHA